MTYQEAILDKGALGFCILLHQREKNRAIGIDRDTQMLRGLASFVRATHKELVSEAARQIVKASFLKASIDEHRALAERLTDYIMENIEDDDIRNEGVQIVKTLESHIHQLGVEFEEVTR